jgi:transcriptional regulator with XRE-family HTH domain
VATVNIEEGSPERGVVPFDLLLWQALQNREQRKLSRAAKFYRRQRGLPENSPLYVESMKEIAWKLGIGYSMLSDWANGKRTPKRKTVERVASILESLFGIPEEDWIAGWELLPDPYRRVHVYVRRDCKYGHGTKPVDGQCPDCKRISDANARERFQWNHEDDVCLNCGNKGGRFYVTERLCASCYRYYRRTGVNKPSVSYCEICGGQIALRNHTGVCHRTRECRTEDNRRRKGYQPRSVTQHGTAYGYELHRKLRSGEWLWPACDECRDAERKRRGVEPRPLCLHGTTSGYNKHLKLKESDGEWSWPACGECTKAVREYSRTRKHSRPFQPASHGTYSGYQKHRKLKETDGEWNWPACEPCRIAMCSYKKKVLRPSFLVFFVVVFLGLPDMPPKSGHSKNEVVRFQ